MTFNITDSSEKVCQKLKKDEDFITSGVYTKIWLIVVNSSLANFPFLCLSGKIKASNFVLSKFNPQSVLDWITRAQVMMHPEKHNAEKALSL